MYSLPGTFGGIIINKENAYQVAMFKDTNAIRYGLWTVDEWTWGTTGIVPKIDDWVFIAITYDGSRVNCYENCILKGQNSQTGSIRTTDFSLCIGSRYFSDDFSYNNFHGVIDDVCIYERALSQSEIEELYSSSPIAYQSATLDSTTWEMAIPSIQVNNNRYAIVLNYLGGYRWALDISSVKLISENISCATLDNTWAMTIPTILLRNAQFTETFTAVLNYLGNYSWQLRNGSLRGIKLDCPFVDNADILGNTCVASSFTMVLQYYGTAVTLDDVLAVVGTPPFSDPTHSDFASWIEREFNLEMVYLTNSTIDDVIQFLVQGHPAVVHQQFLRTEQTGHNRVVIGYDTVSQDLTLNDPSYLGPGFRMSYSDFAYLWEAIASFEPVPSGELFLITPK